MSLPPSTSIGRVTLQVANLDRSLGFYRDVIGFRQVRGESDSPSTAHLGVEDSDTVWLELREKPGARAVPPRGLLGLYHFAVLLPSQADLGRFFMHAVNSGVQVASADHLVSEALYLVDPDGLTVELYRDRPRSEWPHAGGEISMASVPLNIDDLVRAAANGPRWSSLPTGTAVGHMHFYVGDLAAAERFYHLGLGFDRVVWSFPGALFVSAGGYHHHVGLNVWARHARAATDADARLVEWELVLPDREAVGQVHRRISAAGYAATPTPLGVVVVDPWGIAAHVRVAG